MRMYPWTVVSVAGFLLLSAAPVQASPQPDRLFRDNAIIDVRIVAPMSTLLSERPNEEELPGKLQFDDAAGAAVDLDVEIRTRGRFRRLRDVCRFPPLRLDLKGSQTKGTLFAKQDKLKLVTHCKDSNTFEQVILREYIAYRILNTMTDVSFRVRLMRITYVDSEEKRNDEQHLGFVIEHRDRLAKRSEKKYLEIPRTSVRSLEPSYSNLVSMYQFMIGNTDFSPIIGSNGEPCCHNHVLFGNEGEPVWSVPYDFDQSGLVNAPYAKPNEKFRIRSVRQRLYRGRCMHNEKVPDSINLFIAKRDEIFGIVNGLDLLSKKSRASLVKYIESFYEIIEDEKKVSKSITKRCV